MEYPVYDSAFLANVGLFFADDQDYETRMTVLTRC